RAGRRTAGAPAARTAPAPSWTAEPSSSGSAAIVSRRPGRRWLDLGELADPGVHAGALELDGDVVRPDPPVRLSPARAQGVAEPAGGGGTEPFGARLLEPEVFVSNFSVFGHGACVS